MSDLEEDGPVEPDGDTGEFVCPECGQSFTKAVGLGYHRRRAHGVEGKHARKKSDRAPGPQKNARKAKIRGALVDLADLADDLRGREGSGELPATLSGVIRRDADQLATTISAIASQVEPVRWFVDTLLVKVLGPVVGASGVLRWFLREARLRRERAEIEQAQIPYDPALTGESEWRGPPPAPEPLLEDSAAA